MIRYGGVWGAMLSSLVPHKEGFGGTKVPP